MPYEVEQKFPVLHADSVLERLLALGIALAPPVEQIDAYFAHPARDFAATDEALRLRRDGAACQLTYKGPRLDGATKTRRELEVGLASEPQTLPQAIELLHALGFRDVAQVRKRRRTGPFVWHGHTLHVALDEVDQLGWFVELEEVVASDDGIGPAREAILALAQAAGLDRPERRSYLELLLAQNRPA